MVLNEIESYIMITHMYFQQVPSLYIIKLFKENIYK